jgi:hypothetical protein
MKAVMKASLAIACLGLWTGCATDEGMESTPSESVTTEAISVTSATWHVESGELCADIFMRPCNARQPSNQCAAGVASGQPCTTVGAICNKVNYNNTWYFELSCY